MPLDWGLQLVPSSSASAATPVNVVYVIAVHPPDTFWTNSTDRPPDPEGNAKEEDKAGTTRGGEEGAHA